MSKEHTDHDPLNVTLNIEGRDYQLHLPNLQTANVGNHTLYLAAVADCQVAAFEPNPALVQAIETSRALNQLDGQIEVFAAGVGAQSGYAQFDYLDEHNLGAQRLALSGEEQGALPVITLDEQTWAQPVKVIKVDVEGMELAVLQGAEQLIKQDQPLLYIECQHESEFVQIHQWLAERGYVYWDTFNATPTHLFLPTCQVSSDQLQSHNLYQTAREHYRTVVQQNELRKKLDASAQKYRAANVQIDELKQKLIQGQEEIHHLGQRLSEANEKYRHAREVQAELQQKLAQWNEKYRDASQQLVALKKLQSDVEQEQHRLKAVESRHQQLEQQQAVLRDALDHANDKYRQATEQVHTLKLERQQAQLQYEASAEVLALTQDKLVLTQDQLSAAQGQCSQFEQQLEVTQGELQRNQQQLKESQATNARIEQSLEQVRQTLSRKEALIDQYQATEEAMAHRLQQGEEVNQNLKAQMLQGSEQLEQIKQQQHVLKIQLDQANSKYRQATAEQIPVLKQQLEHKTADVRELQEKLQQLNQQLSASEDRRRAVEKRLLDLRASLTFKTGYLIREQSRSLMGLLKLPVGLWRLYQQGKKRAQQRSARQAKVIASSVSPVKPVLSPAEKQNKADFKTPEPLTLDKGTTALAHLLLPTQGQPGQKKVACIMDDFTFNCYQPECQLQQLTPGDWQQELEAFQPELLFIESAWRGKDELWGSKVGHQSEEVKGIVRWCNEQQVPTVFWNKEDPVHFETFLSTAKLFDFIFTTDIDCLHRYKAALGHDRVYLLPFACQPAVHNPMEVYQRKDAFSFAGAYYVRYPHRTKDLEGFVEHLPGFRPLEIYDRNYGKDNPDYQFPDNYQPYIVGTLPFNEIDKAYKGYRYAINLNSIKQSQSMFARRVFELLASNTLTISNFSRGIRLMFGDLVLATDSGEQVVDRLQALAKTPEDEDKLRLRGLRKVMQEHTYQDRMHYILSKVEGVERKSTLSEFAVFAPVDTEQALASVITQVLQQKSVVLTFYPVVSGDLTPSQAQQQLQQAGLNGVALSQQDLAGQTLTDLVTEHCWCTAFLPEDYYGPNYLLDIALARRYSQAQVVGKAAFYQYQDDALSLVNEGLSYRGVTALPMRSSAIHPDLARNIQVADWLTQLAEGQYEFEAQLSIDRFNYCRDGAVAALSDHECQVLTRVNELALDPGIATDTLLSTAEQIQPLVENKQAVKRYGPEFLAELIGVAGSKKVSLTLSQEGLEVRSELADGKHEYFYAQRELSRDELFDGLESGDQLPLFFDLEPGLNISLVVLYLDASKQRISHQILRGNANHTLELPLETAFVRLGLRVYAGGQAAIKAVLFDHKDLQPARLLAQSDTLLLTNHYASYSDLYRNGFVHSRVKSYREQGVAVDIFRLRNNEAVSWHEFQGVDVTTGSQEALRRLLASGQYRHVLVHFLDEDMWQVLQEFIDQIKVTVWLHGAEVQPWWRRQFNYQTDEQLALAKLQSEKRIAFWQGLLNPMPANLQLVFVSNYLAQVVMEDLQLELPQSQYHIIHNPINTDLFNYQEKPAEQRKKLLSIRPYASRTYANDLTVEALLELSKEPWFDELEIRLIGDGPLFDDTLAPLKKFSNITLEKRFLTQDEIAQYHKEYGIFLCPSRMDTQGVSRDEAMASGLVPVTNAVAAIPEFADEHCAILAPEDDAHAMAEGIRTLYKDAELFLQMSENAAQRVKGNVAQNIIVRNELSVLER